MVPARSRAPDPREPSRKRFGLRRHMRRHATTPRALARQRKSPPWAAALVPRQQALAVVDAPRVQSARGRGIRCVEPFAKRPLCVGGLGPRVTQPVTTSTAGASAEVKTLVVT